MMTHDLIAVADLAARPPGRTAVFVLSGAALAGNDPLALAPACVVALVEPGGAGHALALGADFVLPVDAADDLVCATVTRACALGDERLRARMLDAVLDHVSDAVELTDTEFRYVRVNAAYEQMTGYHRDEVLGTAPSRLRSPVHTTAFYDEITNTVTSGHRWQGSIVAQRKDGALIEQLLKASPVVDPDGSIAGYVAVKQYLPAAIHEDGERSDVAPSVHALAQAQLRHRRMMDACADAIMVFDAGSGRNVDANAAACVLFGYTRAELRQLTARALAGPVPDAVAARAGAQLETTGSAFERRYPYRRKNGSGFVGDAAMAIYEFMGRRQLVVVVRDVTSELERERRLEDTNRNLEATRAQLVHSSRLAVVGQMAAGIAHEINNPLQYSLAALDELQASLGATEAAREPFREIREGLDRIRALARALLPFAREEPLQGEPFDLSQLVAALERPTAAALRSRARLDLRLAPAAIVTGDATSLNQVISHLVSNAVHAIGEGDPVRNCVTLSTDVRGDVVELVVADTGCGIAEDIRPHVFNPFFSTKAREQATGLGLALCAQIVERHRGQIRFDSEVGHGTRFVVTLPVCREPVRAPTDAMPAAARERARARVLIIDDDPLVLKCYRRSLESLTEVHSALGGKAALDMLAVDRDFDVIVCDLMMPVVDGQAVYEHAKTEWSGLERRILFCSGGAVTPRTRDFLRSVDSPFISKPITLAALRERVLAMAGAAR